MDVHTNRRLFIHPDIAEAALTPGSPPLSWIKFPSSSSWGFQYLPKFHLPFQIFFLRSRGERNKEWRRLQNSFGDKIKMDTSL
jgi:hypothetical protein